MLPGEMARGRQAPTDGLVGAEVAHRDRVESTGVEPYLTLPDTFGMHAGLYPHPSPVNEGSSPICQY
jgi:hypothetical protein